MKIRNHFNADSSSAFEDCSQEILTVPDQTYSVKELFQRMAQGLPLDDRVNVYPTYFDDDEDIDNPDPTQRPDFDLVDYEEEMSVLLDKQRSIDVTDKPKELVNDSNDNGDNGVSE